MAQVSDQEILEALKGVRDPDRDADIVNLGMVSGLAVKDGNVAFAIEVDPERGDRLEPVRKAAEDAVMGLAGVVSVSAVLTAERPPGPAPQSPPGQAARPAPAPAAGAEPEAQKPLVPGVDAIIAVASGKGGVGKSTVAVNLALGMAAAGHKIGVLDADIYGPSMPRMMGISGRPASPDGKVLIPMENYGVKCMSIGFLVAEDTPMIWRGPMVMGALQQMLRDVKWGELDVLVVDMPPGTGDAQLTMAQSVPLAGAILVSTPQDIALLDARRGLNMFQRVNVPILGIIENMSYFNCPNCGHRTEIFSHGGARAEAEKLGVDFLGEVPLDVAIRETSDGGRPIVVSDPESDNAKRFRAIADKVWDLLAARKTGAGKAPPRIVIQ
ncbi:MAG: iron-sulfur cluster carrier protein ApbC [Proteobacteria bacterium]|nr:iron-sulfur cluster carrier protein ApbC [Pseudomonadota bacterium]MCH8098706.1 iron-sulfur cluster carrier protein ApbC [Pseudomonadota bacterium]